MITVTLNKVNGVDITNDIRGIQSSDVVAGSLRPLTANNTATAAIFKVQVPNGSSPNGFEIQEWQVTETYAAVQSALTADIQDGAPINSPTFTGVPAAPTAAPGTNTTQIATTAFVAALGALKEDTANKATDFTTVNDTKFPTTKALVDGFQPVWFKAASGTDTYTANLVPVPINYYTGMEVKLTFANTNTGAATINLNSLGAKDIRKGTGGVTALAAADLVVGKVYTLIYDGTNFQINIV